MLNCFAELARVHGICRRSEESKARESMKMKKEFGETV